MGSGEGSFYSVFLLPPVPTLYPSGSESMGAGPLVFDSMSAEATTAPGSRNTVKQTLRFSLRGG